MMGVLCSAHNCMSYKIVHRQRCDLGEAVAPVEGGQHRALDGLAGASLLGHLREGDGEADALHIGDQRPQEAQQRDLVPGLLQRHARPPQMPRPCTAVLQQPCWRTPHRVCEGSACEGAGIVCGKYG